MQNLTKAFSMPTPASAPKKAARQFPTIKAPSPLVRFGALVVFALPANLLAQTVVEYALRTAGSAVSAHGGPAIAGCTMNSALLNCLSDTYPRATIAFAVVIGLLLLRWLAGFIGYGTR
jgi:hypothetical protein